MRRKELVRLVVLNAICDDYENIDQIILPNVINDAAECSVAGVDRGEIVEALTGLVTDGLAEVFILSGHEPFAVRMGGMPPVDVIEEDFKTYFFITEKGMQLHLADDTWPLKLDEPA
jgi:hypothetical protein